MGKIAVSLKGSFDKTGFSAAQFRAQEYGHARCVADTIKWLAEVVMPRAIRLDHELHEEGITPSKGFGTKLLNEIYPDKD